MYNEHTLQDIRTCGSCGTKTDEEIMRVSDSEAVFPLPILRKFETQIVYYVIFVPVITINLNLRCVMRVMIQSGKEKEKENTTRILWVLVTGMRASVHLYTFETNVVTNRIF